MGLWSDLRRAPNTIKYLCTRDEIIPLLLGRRALLLLGMEGRGEVGCSLVLVGNLVSPKGLDLTVAHPRELPPRHPTPTGNRIREKTQLLTG